MFFIECTELVKGPIVPIVTPYLLVMITGSAGIYIKVQKFIFRYYKDYSKTFLNDLWIPLGA